MDVTRKIEVRSQAKGLRDEAWKKRLELWRQPISDSAFKLQAPDKIASALLGLRVREIPSFPARPGNLEPAPTVVGMLNRSAKEVIISQIYGLERKRFTLAHEIGHYVLHPGLIQHRELAIELGSKAPRSREEREADLFAAELLMPSEEIRAAFMARFCGAIDATGMGEALYFWLSSVGNGPVNREKLYAPHPEYRAIQIAKAKNFFGRWIVSLCEEFRVSQNAMAIQLIDLGLVK